MAIHYNQVGHWDLSSLKSATLEVIPNNIKGIDSLKELFQQETFLIVTIMVTQ